MSVERLIDDVETVERFCYVGNELSASCSSEMTVVGRTRIGRMRFRKCGESFVWKKVFVENERESVSDLSKIGNTIIRKRNMVFERKRSGIIKKNRKSIIRALSGVKLIDRNNTKELMRMLDVAVPIERLVRATTLRWYEHVMQREEGYRLLKYLEGEKRGRPKANWKKRIKALVKDIALRKEDDPSRKKWRLGVETVKESELNPATFVYGDNTG